MSNSNQLFKAAQKLFPGGVNSPVRAFRGVGGEPFFVKRGRGAYLMDVEGSEYIDYVCSWGACIVGHAHPAVVKAVTETLQEGFSFGAPTELEVKLAERIQKHMPSLEMMRFVSSGTEAVMSAIRLARGFTKRDKIIKFASCYHGHSDSLLVQAGSGCLTLSLPNSLGVPNSFVEHTLVAEYNRLETVEQLFKQHKETIACVIVEPVAGNMGCILPARGFLTGLRALCDQYGSVLIFDEVITGFRVALGGAGAYYNVTPDLTTLGKVIGGGMPVGAFGGKKEIMQLIAPLGPVYQAGTLSGNPIAMSAGLATLALIEAEGAHETLQARAEQLTGGLKQIAAHHQLRLEAVAIGGLFGICFVDERGQCDVETFKHFFHGMLKAGVYFAPSAFEAGFVSLAHNESVIAKTLAAAESVMVSRLSK